MQFVELQNVGREVLREAFGVHGHILGLSEDVNRANAEAADVSFARRLLVPRADRFKGALNSDFLPLFGDMGKGYEFVYTSPVPEDLEADNAERASKTTAYSVLVRAGVNPDDAAIVCGLPPMRHAGVLAPQSQPNLVGASYGS
jgi:phage portal protein BeeE